MTLGSGEEPADPVRYYANNNLFTAECATPLRLLQDPVASPGASRPTGGRGLFAGGRHRGVSGGTTSAVPGTVPGTLVTSQSPSGFGLITPAGPVSGPRSRQAGSIRQDGSETDTAEWE
jgi:hypothetical protein